MHLERKYFSFSLKFSELSETYFPFFYIFKNIKDKQKVIFLFKQKFSPIQDLFGQLNYLSLSRQNKREMHIQTYMKENINTRKFTSSSLLINREVSNERLTKRDSKNLPSSKTKTSQSINGHIRAKMSPDDRGNSKQEQNTKGKHGDKKWKHKTQESSWHQAQKRSIGEQESCKGN